MENSFISLMEERFKKQYKKIADFAMADIEKDFNEVWKEFLKDLEQKKQELILQIKIEQGKANADMLKAEEAKKILDNALREIKEAKEVLTNTNNEILLRQKELEEITEQKNNIIKRADELISKEKELIEKEIKLKGEEDIIKVEKAILKDKESSLKRIFNEINK